MNGKALIAVITGGRPLLSHRPTAKKLDGLAEAGFDVEWVIRESHVDGYETDGHPFNVFTEDWAYDYARTHWRHPLAQCSHGGFFGAFPGREWAMREGARRGYEYVVQLDDNVLTLGPIAANRTSKVVPWADQLTVLGELTMSTNARMVGAQLSAVQPKETYPVMRPGFPYSVFAERTGPGRMSYYGPFEDDVMHAMEYGLNGGKGRTVAVVEGITYMKEHTKRTGMRAHYNSTRGLELVRRYPRNASLREGPRSSSPLEKEMGVRHYLTTRGFTAIRVTDPERYDRAAVMLTEQLAAGRDKIKRNKRELLRKRAGLV